MSEYFDNQRIRLENLIKDKNKQLNSEWMEEYKERQRHQRRGERVLEGVPIGLDA